MSQRQMSPFAEPALTRSNTHTEEQPDHSALLYGEVIRKNHNILRDLLAKIDDIYARQSELQATANDHSRRLDGFVETSENFQFEFRSTYVEMERKHQQTSNELMQLKHEIKRGIYRDSKVNTIDQYLRSSFFNDQANVTESRDSRFKSSDDKRHDIFNSPSQGSIKDEENQLPGSQKRSGRSRHGFIATSKVMPASHVAKQLRSHQQVIEYDSQDESAHNKGKKRGKKERHEHDQTIMELQNKIETASDSLKNKIDEDIAKVVENLENQMDSKLKKLRQQLYATPSSIKSRSTKHKHRSPQDLSQSLSKSIDQSNLSTDLKAFLKEVRAQVQESLAEVRADFAQQVSDQYFHSTMDNLRESWESELSQLYKQINYRATHSELWSIEKEVKASTERINEIDKTINSHIQSRIATATATPQTPPNFEHIDFNPHRKNRGLGKRQCRKFYQSTGSLCSDVRTAAPPSDGPWEEGNVGEKAWKERAAEALGLKKRKKIPRS